MTTNTFNPAKYPSVITSDALLKRLKPGEGQVTVVMQGASSPTAFQFHGRGAKVYVFAWSRRLLAHVLRAPVDLWNGGLAQDLLDQSKLTYPLVPLFELPDPPAPTPAPAARPEPATPEVPSTDENGGDGQQGEVEQGAEAVSGQPEVTQAAAVTRKAKKAAKKAPKKKPKS